MNSTPCPHGRQQVVALSAMNLRAVVSPHEVTYVSRPRTKLMSVGASVSARFQPRDEFGQFSSYAGLFSAMNVEYAWTALEYDTEDEARREEEQWVKKREEEQRRLADNYDGGDAAEL